MYERICLSFDRVCVRRLKDVDETEKKKTEKELNGITPPVTAAAFLIKPFVLAAAVYSYLLG